MAKIETKEVNLGGASKKYWFAYVDGKLLRSKNGVGRHFKTREAAEKAAASLPLP